MLTRRFAVLACCSVLVSWVVAWAQSSYPSRVIHFVVPFAAGAPDSVARIMAQQLQSQMGQSVIVENRPAANGTIATEAVARAAPDGHTLLITSASIAVNPSIYRNLPYNVLTDLSDNRRLPDGRIYPGGESFSSCQDGAGTRAVTARPDHSGSYPECLK